MKNKKVLLRTLATALLMSGGLALAGQTAHAAKGDVAITEENFPDSLFRGYVKKNFDKDKNGKLSLTEISDVKKIDCSGDTLGVMRNEAITDLKGIEYFTNLTELNCNGNHLYDMDLSKNKKLVKLDCSRNGFNTLKLQNNTSLEVLEAHSNLLWKLDLSQNTKLKSLNVSLNSLEELDLSQNTKLEELYCHTNRMTGLDLSKLTNLKILTCSANKLESIDLKKNTKLERLDIETNPLTKVDITKCPKLDEVYKTGTRYKSYDATYVQFHSGEDDFHKKSPWITFDTEDTIISTPLYKDVTSKDWYSSAVEYNRNSGFMSGTGAGTFAPSDKLTRAQFVCVLYNVAGNPPVKYTNKFKDVPNGKWYTNGVMWALEKEVTSGISPNEFGTEVTITREQLATLLYNYAKNANQYTVTFDKKALNKFTDNGQVSSWAKEAMQWAISNGVISGKATNNIIILDPKGLATRAECAQIIMNFMKNTKK